MRVPFIASLVFHFFVIFMLSYGFTFSDDDIIVSPPVNIEIVDISEISQTTKQKPPEPKIEKKEPKPEEKPPEKKQALAKPSAPVPPEEVEEVATPLPDEKAEVIKEKPKPKDKPKEKKEKPKMKETKPLKEEPNDEPFKSVLKNLVGATPSDSEEKEKGERVPDVTQLASLGDKMTISEMDALRRQLEGCWNVPIGAKNAGDLIVEVHLTVRPDKTVQNAKVVDMGRYNREPFFRAAADSAIRAVLSTECSPLILPEGKYAQWKTMTFKFNPKEMF